MLHEVLAFKVRSTDYVSTPMAPVVKLAKPFEVNSTLHPSTQLIRILNSGVLVLKQFQANPILQSPLNMSVVQFQWKIQGAVREVPSSLSNAALVNFRVAFGNSVIVIEVLVMRISHASTMFWVVNVIVAGMHLRVSGYAIRTHEVILFSQM
jgi:hypothetical protein